MSGDGFLYHIPALERLVGLAPREGPGEEKEEREAEAREKEGSSSSSGGGSMQLVLRGGSQAPRRCVRLRLCVSCMAGQG